MFSCSVCYITSGNNPVNYIDPSGQAWMHWIFAAAVVAVFAIATVVTCGGFAAAATAVGLVLMGTAAGTTAATVTASAFVASTLFFTMSALNAYSTSSSWEEFGEQGNWETVIGTAGAGLAGGLSTYWSMRMPKTKVYRSVNLAESQDIKATGRFNLLSGGMESKQFGFNLAETKQFGKMVGQNIIVSAKLPTNALGLFYTGGVDTSIFRSGTLTVYDNQLNFFNELIKGTIKFMP